MAESKTVVLAALASNAGIAILKFGGFLLTGSAAMLSETYHSISDTGNQIFLLVGIRASSKEPNRKYPFGRGKAEFFYSFLVSILLFGIAGWESVKEGYNGLVHHEAAVGGHAVSFAGFHVPPIDVSYAILVGGIFLEGYSLWKAYTSIQTEVEENDWSGLWEAFHKSSQVTVLTSLTENSVAVVGLLIALVGLGLTQVTGNPVYDSAAAVLIGLALMGFALALAVENKRLLIGESLPREAEARLRAHIREHDGVRDLIDFRSVYFGPEEVVVAEDVAFDDDLDVGDVEDVITRLEDDLKDRESTLRQISIEPKSA
ncbi:MAG: cation diffusion facilitator family transporter [Salinigranum sp.]